MLELLTYYVIVAIAFVGAPGVFLFIVFMPAIQNTKGRMVGYKDHKFTEIVLPTRTHHLALKVSTLKSNV